MISSIRFLYGSDKSSQNAAWAFSLEIWTVFISRVIKCFLSKKGKTNCLFAFCIGILVHTMRINTNGRCFALLLGANQGLYKLWLASRIDSALERMWEPCENISISEDTGNKRNDHKKQSLNKESLKIWQGLQSINMEGSLAVGK